MKANRLAIKSWRQLKTPFVIPSFIGRAHPYWNLHRCCSLWNILRCGHFHWLKKESFFFVFSNRCRMSWHFYSIAVRNHLISHRKSVFHNENIALSAWLFICQWKGALYSGTDAQPLWRSILCLGYSLLLTSFDNMCVQWKPSFSY